MITTRGTPSHWSLRLKHNTHAYRILPQTSSSLLYGEQYSATLLTYSVSLLPDFVIGHGSRAGSSVSCPTPTMPERTEVYVQHTQLLNFISQTCLEDRVLQQIWVDPLPHEMPVATDPRARQGLMYPITEATNVVRKGCLVHPTSELGYDLYITPFALSGCPFHPESLLLEFEEFEVGDEQHFVCKVSPYLSTGLTVCLQ